jgi:hypothetical protein
VTKAFVAVAASGLLFLLLVVAGRPKVTMGIAFCAIISSRSLWFATDIDAFGYLDEVCVGAVFAWQVLIPFAMGRRIRSFPGLAWFGTFAALGFISAFVAGVPLAWALDSAFLTLKGVLFGWSVAQLDWTRRHPGDRSPGLRHSDRHRGGGRRQHDDPRCLDGDPGQ